MTLISEQFFKPYSTCQKSPRFESLALPAMIDPALAGLGGTGFSAVSSAGRKSRRPKRGGQCPCRKKDMPSGEASEIDLSENRRKRLARLIDRDLALLERGQTEANHVRRSKLIARLARAVKAMGQDVPETAPPDQTEVGQQPVSTWPHSEAVPMGVEAFRMALAKELTLLRNKKENIP